MRNCNNEQLINLILQAQFETVCTSTSHSDIKLLARIKSTQCHGPWKLKLPWILLQLRDSPVGVLGYKEPSSSCLPHSLQFCGARMQKQRCRESSSVTCKALQISSWSFADSPKCVSKEPWVCGNENVTTALWRWTMNNVEKQITIIRKLKWLLQ